MTDQIEKGGPAQMAPSAFQADAETQWEQGLSDDQRQGLQQSREYDATRPSTDPNAAATNYMGSAN